MTTKKLYKSNTDKVFAGVLGGVGEYFDVDPTILRLGYVLFSFITHLIPALILYIVAAIIIPKKPAHSGVKEAEYSEEKSTN